jgi:hypothetical protein
MIPVSNSVYNNLANCLLSGSEQSRAGKCIGVVLLSLYVEHHRAVHQLVVFVQHAGIHIADAVAAHIAVTFVNMATHMGFGPYLADLFQQVPAAYVLPVNGDIVNAKNRSVRDDNIGTGRDQLPVFVDGSPSWLVEGPAVKPGGDGRAPEGKPVDSGSAVVQVRDPFGNEFLDSFELFLFEEEIMISRDKHFVLNRQVAKPVQEVDNFGTLAPVRHIARMYNKIAARYSYAVVSAMGISYDNNSQIKED